MRSSIESIMNSKVKLAASLHQKKHREANGLFLVEGVRLAEMALDSGWSIVCGYYEASVLTDERISRLLINLEEVCPLYEVTNQVFRRMSETQTPQGVLLVMRMQETSSGLEELLKKETPLIAVLEDVRDPGNVGTILRTADAAGVDGVVLLGDSADVFSSKVIRASMGSFFHVPLVLHISHEDFFRLMKKHELPLLAAALDDSARIYYEQDFRGASVIAFGNEAGGLSAELLSRAADIYIPIHGHAESLNVATAASVILYEAVRQRSLG